MLRHSRSGKHLRKYDDVWTFGKPNSNGYLVIGTEVIHRIVATAFHGEPPTSQHIVDHKDTNRQNNRPENLQWLTKLQNILNNPITRRNVELVCGSIDNFLKDPSILRNHTNVDPNFKWMCTVSKEQGQICLENRLAWAKSDHRPSGGSLGEWIFSPDAGRISRNERISEVPELLASNTVNAAQRNWSTPSEFPCCPKEPGKEPIVVYADKLNPGSVFCRNNVYTSLVLKSSISDDRQSLYVFTESSEGEKATKPWALAEITFENDLFVHTNIQSFFSQEGAEKQFTLAQGLEWTGGDSIDDYA